MKTKQCFAYHKDCPENECNYEIKEEKIMAHTPTPWKLEENEILGSRYVCKVYNFATKPSSYKAENEKLQAEFEANADFIVTACNAHDDLVNRLKDNTEALLDFHKEHPTLFGQFFGAHFVEMKEEALTKAGVKS